MRYKNRLSLILDVFSRRRPTVSDYKEDDISPRLRSRILLLYRDIISGRWNKGGNHAGPFWDEMHNSLQHLYGRFRLSERPAMDETEDTVAFLQECSTIQFFDFIELSFKLEVTRHITTDGSDVVDAVNQVFRVERAPYQLTSMVWIEEKRNRIVYRRPSAYPKVIRTEDEVTSEMAVVPALSVLTAPHFESASLEFRDALEEYRKGDYGDCLTKCSSALESTLKVLCTKNGWIANERVTINQLLDTVVDQTTLDSFFKQPLVLIATMRNRLSKSHGGGSSVRTVERHIAEYAITSTAAAIVLLVRDLNN